MKKPHIIKTKRGYHAVVEGGQAKELTNKKDVAEIKRLLKVRRDAGVELSKLIRDRGVTTASEFEATRTLGE
jgi:hypothetical protein